MVPWSSIVSFLTFFNFIFNLFSIAIVYMKGIVIFVYTKTISMGTLENKIKNLTTEMLIETFKGLENDNTDEATIVNNLVMSELENRLTEDAYCELLDEVYAD